MTLPTRNYLLRFTDGAHAYQQGIDGPDAARIASAKWNTPVQFFVLPGTRDVRVHVRPRP